MSHVHVEIGVGVFDRVPDFEEHPFVELRCGDVPLGRLNLVADYTTESVAVPAVLRAKLRGLRGRIAWGRFESGGEAVASIWMDPPTRREKRALADMHRSLAKEPSWIRRVLEAQILLDQEFDHAAAEVAKGVLARHAKEPHAAAVLQAAHALMGVTYTTAGLDHDDLVYELREMRGRSGRKCELEASGRPPRRRAGGPAGGCGWPRPGVTR